jgi:hypothetical protein
VEIEARSAAFDWHTPSQLDWVLRKAGVLVIFRRMSLVLYSSSESDHEESQAAVQATDDAEKKNDRVRLFPHQEGNWALSIYAFGNYHPAIIRFNGEFPFSS